MRNNNNQTIAILSGAIKKTSLGWRSTRINEPAFGAPASNWRVIAATIEYKKNPLNSLMATGYKGGLINDPKSPTLAQVVKEELINLGVPAKNIIKEEKSNNTFEQLINIFKMAREKNLKKLLIITNAYHLPRASAMVKYQPGFKTVVGKINFKFVSAEDILIKHDKILWLKKINQAYNSQLFKKLAKQNTLGIKNIKNGTYNYVFNKPIKN